MNTMDSTAAINVPSNMVTKPVAMTLEQAQALYQERRADYLGMEAALRAAMGVPRGGDIALIAGCVSRYYEAMDCAMQTLQTAHSEAAGTSQTEPLSHSRPRMIFRELLEPVAGESIRAGCRARALAEFGVLDTAAANSP